MNIYKTSDFKFRFDWVSDEDKIRGAGCVIDDFDFTGYIETSQTTPKYIFYSGTSMATPFVAGLASLVKSYDMSLGFQEIKDAILNFGDSLASLSHATITGKRINIFNTLHSLRKVGNISIGFPDIGKEAGQNVTLQLKVLDTKGQIYDSYTGSLVFQGSSDV